MGFWHGKKVLLTGHTGFKGSWLSLWLNLLGAKVTGFSISAEKDSLFARAGGEQLVKSVMGDIRQPDALAETFQSSQPGIVFHLAAQALVRPGFADPVGTFATNVMGTINVLEAVRRTPSVRAVVIVTSDKCYENREWVWGYREQDPMGGYDPYSASKGCAELVTSSYRRSFFGEGAAVASVRAGNVIGGGDWAVDRIVPDIIRAVSKGEPVLVRSPNAVRPWQHVCEPLHGYMMLAERLYAGEREFAEGWNFGPNDEGATTVGRLVDSVCRQWGRGASWEKDPNAHPHEANYLKLDCSKARARLGWRPRLNVSQALEWTVEWYRDCLGGADERSMTEQQIIRYQGLNNNE